ncbi:EF-hand domain-containing protein [Rheinheimera mangrovi]|uniref:EF-hand domain-containing protein n=1 Tax=Rheinheimera mangrovi TaxID=2498451 RepID=UPI000F8D3022|nr:EF-hand domain-containing protein [Rheinheimera mangrovi]
MSIQFSAQSAYNTGYTTRPQLSKEQLTEAAGNLFGKLDSQNKGYLEQSDFSSLLSGLQNDEASTKSKELFSSLDSDGDGQLTSYEFSDNFSNLLYSAQGTMGPRPAPPQDNGKSKDELTAMLEELEQDDEKSSEGLQSLLDNFDTADTDGDGKVTMQEAMAYKQSTEDSAGASSAQAMPPPPPGAMGSPNQDSGITAEELTALLDSTGETDSEMAATLQSLIDNFDSADSDGDGKVTMQEANSFRESQQAESSLASKVSTGSDQSESISKLLSRTMQQLMDTYGGFTKTNSQSGSAVNMRA